MRDSLTQLHAMVIEFASWPPETAAAEIRFVTQLGVQCGTFGADHVELFEVFAVAVEQTRAGVPVERAAARFAECEGVLEGARSLVGSETCVGERGGSVFDDEFCVFG